MDCMRDPWNLSGVVDIFFVLIMMMASWVCTYAQAQQIRSF